MASAQAEKVATHAVNKAAETVKAFAPSKSFSKTVKDGTSTVYGDGKEAITTVYTDAKDIVKDLTPEAKKMIVAIANKLEKTTNQVWDILVKQQKVWSWCYLLLTIGAVILWYRFYIQFNVMKKELTEEQEMKESNIALTVIFGITAVVSSCYSSYHFVDMMTGFMNPEYGAMKSIYQVYMSLNIR